MVLDLDETLVCAYETSSLPAIIRAQAAEAGLKLFELECVSSDNVCRSFLSFWFLSALLTFKLLGADHVVNFMFLD